ncbi:MAG: hypothetical protein OXO56_03940 [Gammaproteobacteria bacterium]|nr:hypothetical protein [Gammaproteobacteria bacterium]
MRGHAVLLLVLAIDRYLAHAGRHGGGAGQHVDSKRQAAAEGTTAMVPPGELRFIRVRMAEEVGEPRIGKHPIAVPLFAGAGDRGLQV